MTNAELRAAAERSSAWYEGCLEHVVTLTTFERGHGELARAWLAEHPADDDELIDEAWLRSVGFVTEPGRFCLQGTRLQFTNFQGWNAWWGIDGHPHASSRLVDGINTRGQFKRLLAVLGIALRATP